LKFGSNLIGTQHRSTTDEETCSK